jgi:hypothetical protein
MSGVDHLVGGGWQVGGGADGFNAMVTNEDRRITQLGAFARFFTGESGDTVGFVNQKGVHWASLAATVKKT